MYTNRHVEIHVSLLMFHKINDINKQYCSLILTVLVTTIDALGYFETG